MIVSLMGLKGGIGKTTLSVCFAAECHLRGKKVLLVDADPQGSAQKWREKAEREEMWPQVIAYTRPILHKANQVRELSLNYDVTVVDTPPFDGDMSRSALMISDVVLLPVTPSGLDIEELKRSLILVEGARTINQGLEARIVISAKPPTSVFGRSMRNILDDDDFLSTPILKSEVCNRIQFREITILGELIHTYAPRSKARKEIKSLADEVLQIHA